jgi:hypothetical protein
MAAGLQQGQHQRGELVAHRDAGEAHARALARRAMANDGPALVRRRAPHA